MQNKWSTEEKKLLEEKSRFVFEEPKIKTMTPLSAFLDPVFLSEFLKKEAERIGSDNQKVAASIFIKRAAFVVVGTLISWSFLRKPLVFSPENVWLFDDRETTVWLPKFYIEKTMCGENRREMEEALCYMSDLVASVKKATGSSSFVLWENVAVYIFWLYEAVAQEAEAEKAKEDFQWLLAAEQARFFGGGETNMLASYFTEKKRVKGQEKPVRIRTTCCLNFQLKREGKKCVSCPLQNKQADKERKKETG